MSKMPPEVNVLEAHSKPRWIRFAASALYGAVFAGLLHYMYPLMWISVVTDQTDFVYAARSWALFLVVLLVASIGGLICSVGANTPRKQFWGRIYLWLPPVSVFLYSIYPYFSTK